MVPAAIEAMTRELSRVGNPSSLHGSGRAARRVVEESREAIAACLGAQPSEVIFTSGGTEADNLAIKGAFWAKPDATRLVSSTIEHHAVLESVEWLAHSQGATLELIDCDAQGRLDLGKLEGTLATDPARIAVVSVMWANNEVGVLQPIQRIAELCRAAGVLVHSDAVQAVGQVPVDFAASGLDALSFTAHKVGGPVGVGALLAKRELTLASTQHGGGQERDIRSGTLDVAGIAGFAAAVETAQATLAEEASRVRRLRDRLIAGVLAQVENASLNGPTTDAESLPGIANVTFAGCDADAVLMLLDQAGIDCSTGSACTAGVSQPSHVLIGMGRSVAEAKSSLRFSLGHTTTKADVEALLAALPEAVNRARLAGAF